MLSWPGGVAELLVSACSSQTSNGDSMSKSNCCLSTTPLCSSAASGASWHEASGFSLRLFP